MASQDGVHSRVLERRCDVHNSLAIKHAGDGGRDGGEGEEGVQHIPVLINLQLV